MLLCVCVVLCCFMLWCVVLCCFVLCCVAVCCLLLYGLTFFFIFVWYSAYCSNVFGLFYFACLFGLSRVRLLCYVGCLCWFVLCCVDVCVFWLVLFCFVLV